MNASAGEFAWFDGLLILGLAWPLVLVVMLTLPPLRRFALRLVPWAPLPALSIAIAAPAALLPLPGLLLGGSLQLDPAGRWTLTAVALLWLAGGWLGARWLCTSGRALAWLLALGGLLWLPLAGDLPSMLAASVLAAYPLYALLGGGRGARALLVSIVIADLLILEAVLLLAKGGAGLDFDALRAALAEAEGRDLVLALFLLGFGAKAGLVGLHYWVAPVLEEAPSRLLGPVVAFIVAAGLLPIWRLAPVGEVAWASLAAVLPWLALIGCVWALIAGFLQRRARTRIAYLLSALASLWLGLLGLALSDVSFGVATNRFFPLAGALSSLSAAALLLLRGASVRPGRSAAWALLCAAILPGLLALLGAALLVAAQGLAEGWPVMGSFACVGILFGAAAARSIFEQRAEAVESEAKPAAVMIAGGLGMAAVGLLSALRSMEIAGGSVSLLVLSVAVLLLGGFVLDAIAARYVGRLPRLPAGDLLGTIERAVARLSCAWRVLGLFFGQWRDRFKEAGARLRLDLARSHVVDGAEDWLRRWSTATVLLLLAGALVALFY